MTLYIYIDKSNVYMCLYVLWIMCDVNKDTILIDPDPLSYNFMA